MRVRFASHQADFWLGVGWYNHELSLSLGWWTVALGTR